ncbi:Prevent-host-death family protein [Oscillatoriales cyanobacterium USR001]|nr:Prevent-host-death family protein [Oscillatoriales cyanobacterium USR001]
MKTVSLAEINAHFNDYLKVSQGESILITDNGHPVAAITLVVDPDELERLMLANSVKFNELLNKSRQSIKENGGMEHDEFWELVDELSLNKAEESN